MEKLIPYLISGRLILTENGQVFMFLNGHFISRQGGVFSYEDIKLIDYISDINLEFLVDGSDFWSEDWVKNLYLYHRKEVPVIQLFKS